MTPRRILVLGGTGTIGRATVKALLEHGHETVCVLRQRKEGRESSLPPGAVLRYGEVTVPRSLANDGFRGERFDVLVSCLASRTGLPEEAWAIDFQAHADALHAARRAGVSHVVLLSAICVQKPRLAFQHAKLAFERMLKESGLTWSIVRPTAYFKSLSGQIERVRQGKSFLLFGDGGLTATKPISDGDLARYLALCIEDPLLQNRVLPIGGPGPAFTPREQGEHLFSLLGKPQRFRSVPPSFLDGVAASLDLLGRALPRLGAKAELARIGHYYATESMLVWDEAAGRYDAEATPSFGTESFFEYQAGVVRGEAVAERGDHAVF